MKLKLNPTDLDQLLECKDYRTFISKLMEIQSHSVRGMSYAKMARLMGVRSRSYPRDIILGIKKMTPAMLPKFAKALGLSSDLAALFHDLVELQEIPCRISGRSEEQIRKSILRIQTRLAQNRPGTLNSEPAFAYADLPIVYAALGTSSQGSTLLDIERRTGFSEDRILPILERMLEFKITQKVGRKYLPLKMHLSETGLKESELFKHYFLKRTEEVLTEARRQMNSEEKLFFSSSFSVLAHQLPELKTELRDLLLRYVDSAEKASGDRVVSLVCALH